jgi:hypothetical protein
MVSRLCLGASDRLPWRDAYRHTTENVGDRTAVKIEIELK